MANESSETQTETGENSVEEKESGTTTAAQKIANQLQGAPVVDDDEKESEEIEAELEAGASDTVPRAELLKAIKRRQSQAARAKKAEEELAELKRVSETESQKAIREAEEKLTKSLTDKYLPALIKTGAEAALLSAGPKKGKAGIPRLIKLMDLSAIEVNSELELEGVEEEVERLKEEFPELFGEDFTPPAKETTPAEEEKPKRRTTTTRAQDGAGKTPPAPKKTTSELIMARLRGEA